MIAEDELRATLRERADEPAVRPDLLERVRGGIRRRNRRRAAVLGAAAVLAAAAAVPGLITYGRSPAPAPGFVPADPAAGWRKPALEPPPFPLTPGWTPAGLGAPLVGRMGPNLMLSYDDDTRELLRVEVGAKPWGWDGNGGDHPVTVHGRPAMLRTGVADIGPGARPGDRYVGIRWQLADGRWVQLASNGPSTEDDVLRFAGDLRPRTLAAAPAQFTVASAPAGLVLQQLSRDHLCLAPEPVAADRDAGGRGICVALTRSSPGEALPEGRRVAVAGRPATLRTTGPGLPTLTVALDAGRVLSVDAAPEEVPLTDDQLIHFAEGITVAPS